MMNKKEKQGGPRPGAGRPKGSTNKLHPNVLLAAIEKKCGDSLENLIADGYYKAIKGTDANLRFSYERMLVAKCVVDPEQSAMIDGISALGGFKVTFIDTQDTGSDES